MTRRTDRLANLIRSIIAEALLRKISDPRIDPARTSITRVEVPEDLLEAKVFFSVLGEESDIERTRRGLQHAAGHFQERIAREVRLRHTPRLEFHYDEKFHNTLETLDLIERAMEEIRQKDRDSDDSGPTAERP